MNDDLVSRLRQLGVVKGARHIKPLPASSERPFESAGNNLDTDQIFPLEILLPGGYVAENRHGSCFVVDHVYPLQFRHGPAMLEDLLRFQPASAIYYTRDNRLKDLDFRDFVFLDTETTGLAGASTLAFMVGVGFFESRPADPEIQSVEQEAFVIRQYILRDFDDEPAMLIHLEDLLGGKAGLITFNGRSFDVPLLDNRFVMNRQLSRLSDLPHIDLLPPARRLWRARLGSCALGALETNLLGLRRTHEDVPGWLIPSMYYNYLRSGDARELTRVFYHNEMDMLSMVSLATSLFRHLDRPADGDALDLLSLGRWQADLGLTTQAEESLRQALAGELSLEAYHEGLYRLGEIYKQTGRRDEAMIVWQQIAFTSTSDVTAHIELAKHFEWYERDVSTALGWTQQALDLVERQPPSPRAQYTYDELIHRRERLLKKVQ